MKLHLYQLTKSEAFNLSKEALNQLGFTIHQADENTTFISCSKLAGSKPDVLFLNIIFSYHITYTTVHLISNTFLGNNATFIDTKGCDEVFCERLYEIIRSASGSNEQFETIPALVN